MARFITGHKRGEFMFTLPNQDEDLLVKETVTFYMPGNIRAFFEVTYKYFNIPEHKQLLVDTGKAEKEKQNLKRIASLKSDKITDEEAMLAFIEEQFEDETEDCDLEILRESIVDLIGIKDAKGNDIAYTEEVLEQIVKYKQPRIALIDMFNTIHSDEGRKRAKRKN